MSDPETLENLRRLVVGGTVEDVRLNDLPEGMLTLVVRLGWALVEVPIFGTDLGWWVRGARAVDGVVPLYLSPESMLGEMAEFAQRDEDYQDGPRCEPLESPERRLIGFRVTIEESGRSARRDFWISISHCKGSPWTEPLQTPRGRRWIAAHERGPVLWERADPRDPGRGIYEIEPWAG